MPKPHPVWVTAKERRESYRPYRREKLRITIEMKSPIASVDGMIPFDAILGYAVLQDLFAEFGRKFGRDSWKGMPRTVWTDPPLPLAKHITSEGRKFYRCSFGVYDGVESVTRWRKRWEDEYDDLVDFGKRKAAVNYKGGRFKNYDMPLAIRSATEIVFYARGWGAEIERLFTTYPPLIGKKTSQGYGIVGKVIVESCSHDWAVWRDGKPTRTIPAEFVADGQHPTMFWGYRSPYYLPEHQALCVMPDPAGGNY